MKKASAVKACALVLAVVFVYDLWSKHHQISSHTLPKLAQQAADFEAKVKQLETQLDTTPAPTLRPTPVPTPPPVPKFWTPPGGGVSKLFPNWPYTKPRAIIHLLIQDPYHVEEEQKVRAAKRVKMLRNMLKLLDRNYNDHFQYPLVFFVPPGFSNKSETLIRGMTRSRVFFADAHMVGPPGLSEQDMATDPAVAKFCSKTWLGYKHMCRFHAAKIYDEPIFEQVEYAMRLDDDSCLTANITTDLFREMHKQGWVYAYHGAAHDSGHCVKGLWDLARGYVKKNNIKTAWFELKGKKAVYNWDEGRVFYNNFEVSRISFWKGAPFQKFFNEIDKANGIYSRRWGDAPIKTLAMQILVPYNKVSQITWLKYSHGSLCKIE